MIVLFMVYMVSCSGCLGYIVIGVNLKNNLNVKVIVVDFNVILLGLKVYVEGYGYVIVVDIGLVIKGNKIDVFFFEKLLVY